MTRFFFPVMVAVICLLRSALQIATFVRYPDLLGKMPPLVFVANNIDIILQVIAAYFAIQKPRLAVIVLAAALINHATLFPLGIAISNNVILGQNYWNGFVISVLSNFAVTLLAYVSWRISRSVKVETSS